jgi:hypothetical protein
MIDPARLLGYVLTVEDVLNLAENTTASWVPDRKSTMCRIRVIFAPFESVLCADLARTLYERIVSTNH